MLPVAFTSVPEQDTANAFESGLANSSWAPTVRAIYKSETRSEISGNARVRMFEGMFPTVTGEKTDILRLLSYESPFPESSTLHYCEGRSVTDL
jgi:hypothetical protein